MNWSQDMSRDVRESDSGLNSLCMSTAIVMVEYLEREISFDYGACDENFSSVVWRRDRLIGRIVQVAFELPSMEVERMEARPSDCKSLIAAQLTEMAKRLQTSVCNVIITDVCQEEGDLDGNLSGMDTPDEVYGASEWSYDPLEVYPPGGQVSTQQYIQSIREMLELDRPVMDPEDLIDGEESDEMPDLIGSSESESEESDDDDGQGEQARAEAGEAEDEISILSNDRADDAARARLGRYLYNVTTRGARTNQISLSSRSESERPKLYVDCRTHMQGVIQKAYAAIIDH